jgi:hypothetical protein
LSDRLTSFLNATVFDFSFGIIPTCGSKVLANDEGKPAVVSSILLYNIGEFATLAMDSYNRLGAPLLYKHANYTILSSYNNDISHLFLLEKEKWV